jgi:hypothetical protein
VKEWAWKGEVSGEPGEVRERFREHVGAEGREEKAGQGEGPKVEGEGQREGECNKNLESGGMYMGRRGGRARETEAGVVWRVYVAKKVFCEHLL